MKTLPLSTSVVNQNPQAESHDARPGAHVGTRLRALIFRRDQKCDCAFDTVFLAPECAGCGAPVYDLREAKMRVPDSEGIGGLATCSPTTLTSLGINEYDDDCEVLDTGKEADFLCGKCVSTESLAGSYFVDASAVFQRDPQRAPWELPDKQEEEATEAARDRRVRTASVLAECGVLLIARYESVRI